jgi:putative ABC transport system permease protein
LRAVLVAGEVALALVVLIGAGLLLRTLGELARVDSGLLSEGVLTARVAVPPSRPAEQIASFYDRLLERVGAMPGVESVGAISRLPLQQWGYNGNFEIEGRPPEPPARQPFAELRIASPGYFRTLGIPLLAGRGFAAQDSDESPGVVLVNQTLARRFWPAEDPVGQRIGWGDEDWYTVIGVVGDVRNSGLDREALGEIYHLAAQAPSREMSLVVRAAGGPEVLADAVRRTVGELDPDATLFSVETMDQVIGGFLARWRFQTLLLGCFAVLALLLAVGGVYGVLSYAVAQRTREIGIRLALGARPADVHRMVVSQGVLLAAAGVPAGLLAALGVNRLLASQLFGVGTADPATLVLATLALLAVAAAACALPARRAARVDPVAALTAE